VLRSVKDLETLHGVCRSQSSRTFAFAVGRTADRRLASRSGAASSAGTKTRLAVSVQMRLISAARPSMPSPDVPQARARGKQDTDEHNHPGVSAARINNE
jgi:hypothetical protein